MPDQIKPHEKKEQTDEERRKAADNASAHGQAGSRGAQVQATAPNQSTKPKGVARGDGPKESFAHAGRAVRAPLATGQQPASPRKAEMDDDSDEFPVEDDKDDIKPDDADASDASFPIDERTERKTRAQETADEEER